MATNPDTNLEDEEDFDDEELDPFATEIDPGCLIVISAIGFFMLCALGKLIYQWSVR